MGKGPFGICQGALTAVLWIYLIRKYILPMTIIPKYYFFSNFYFKIFTLSPTIIGPPDFTSLFVIDSESTFIVL